MIEYESTMRWRAVAAMRHVAASEAVAAIALREARHARCLPLWRRVVMR